MNKKIRNNVTIDDNGVSKRNNSNVSELFEYLNSRNFNNYPNLYIDDGYEVMMVGDGLNDVLAFNRADVSVLTIEQQEEVSPKLMDKTDYIIESIREVSQIDF